MTRPPPPPTPFPYTTLFRSREQQPPPRSLRGAGERCEGAGDEARLLFAVAPPGRVHKQPRPLLGDRLVKEAVDRSVGDLRRERRLLLDAARYDQHHVRELRLELPGHLSRGRGERGDRKSTRLNSSHLGISYAVFCLKKKKQMLCSAFKTFQREHDNNNSVATISLCV